MQLFPILTRLKFPPRECPKPWCPQVQDYHLRKNAGNDLNPSTLYEVHLPVFKARIHVELLDGTESHCCMRSSCDKQVPPKHHWRISFKLEPFDKVPCLTGDLH